MKNVDYLCHKHRSVVKIAFDIGEKPALDYCRTFLRIVSATLESQGTMGLCLNGIMRDKAQFLALSRQSFEMESFDASLFINTSVYYEDDTNSFFTVYSLGCEIFGLPELEIRHVPLMQIDHCSYQIFHLATNYLWDGVKRHTGDVLGSTNNTKVPLFRVKEARDQFSSGLPVLTLTPLSQEESVAVRATRSLERSQVIRALLHKTPEERESFLYSLGWSKTDREDMLKMVSAYDTLPSTTAPQSHEEFDAQTARGQFHITVLLDTLYPDLDDVKAYLRKIGLPTDPMKKLDHVDQGGRAFAPAREKHSHAIGFDYGDCQGVISISHRISQAQQDEIVVKSPLCPEARSLLQEHGSTFELFFSVRKDVYPTNYLRLFAFMIHAALSDPSAIATCHRGTLVELSKAMEDIERGLGQNFFATPYVVLNARFEGNTTPQTVTIYTDGCDAFGLPDFEMHQLSISQLDHHLETLFFLATNTLFERKQFGTGLVTVPGKGIFEAQESLDFLRRGKPVLVLTLSEETGETAHA